MTSWILPDPDIFTVDMLPGATIRIFRPGFGIIWNVKVSGSGRVRDLSCSFSMTHEVWNAGDLLEICDATVASQISSRSPNA